MRKTFPFYTPDFDFDKSISYAVILNMVNRSLFDTTNQPNKSLADANNSTEVKTLANAAAIEALSLFTDEIEKRLLMSKNIDISNTINSILSTAINNDTKDKLFDIVRNFNEIKDTVLQGMEPGDDAISNIRSAVLGDNEGSAVNSVLLLTIYTLDVHTIRKYFTAINTKEMSSNLKMCFRSIGVLGMRHLMTFIIENYLDKYDAKYVSDLREYCQLFCLYISTLADTPPLNGYTSQRAIIMALLKAAYYDGQISRERDFYLDDSLKVMASVGTSRAMNKGPLRNEKDMLYAEAEKVMMDLYDRGFTEQHNKMAEKIIKQDKFKSLGKTRLYEIAKNIARHRGFAIRGQKNVADGGTRSES